MTNGHESMRAKSYQVRTTETSLALQDPPCKRAQSSCSHTPAWFLPPVCSASSISRLSSPGSTFLINPLHMNPHLRIYFLGPDLRHTPSRGPNFDLKYCLPYLIFKLSNFKLHLRTRFGSYHFLLVYFSPVLFTDLLCPAHEGI